MPIRVSIRLTPTSLGSGEIELRGVVAYSAFPTVSLWENRVQLHAAVAAGAVFVSNIQVSSLFLIPYKDSSTKELCV